MFVTISKPVYLTVSHDELWEIIFFFYEVHSFFLILSNHLAKKHQQLWKKLNFCLRQKLTKNNKDYKYLEICSLNCKYSSYTWCILICLFLYKRFTSKQCFISHIAKTCDLDFRKTNKFSYKYFICLHYIF